MTKFQVIDFLIDMGYLHLFYPYKSMIMEKFMLLLVALFMGCSFNQMFAQNSNSEERNKQIALKYHELDPNDFDDILAVDFIGHWNEYDWNRDDHRRAWSNNEASDKIFFIVADDDMVAVKFIRLGENEGKSFSVDVMQFMKIKNGKIVEIWELFNQVQLAALNEYGIIESPGFLTGAPGLI